MYTLQVILTYPTKREVRKIIDELKVPAENRRTVSWLVVSTHLKNMLVKMGFIFPKVRGEKKKSLSCHHPVSFLECNHPCFTFSLPLFSLHTLARQEAFELGATRALVGVQNPGFCVRKKKKTWETKGGSYQEGKKIQS